MEFILEIIGELFTTTAVTKELKYAGIGCLILLFIGGYYYFTL